MVDSHVLTRYADCGFGGIGGVNSRLKEVPGKVGIPGEPGGTVRVRGKGLGLWARDVVPRDKGSVGH